MSVVKANNIGLRDMCDTLRYKFIALRWKNQHNIIYKCNNNRH